MSSLPTAFSKAPAPFSSPPFSRTHFCLRPGRAAGTIAGVTVTADGAAWSDTWPNTAAGARSWLARFRELRSAADRATTPRDLRAIARADRALVEEALEAIAANVDQLIAERERINASIDRSDWPDTAATTEYGGSDITRAERSTWPPDLPLDTLLLLHRIELLNDEIRKARQTLQSLDRATLQVRAE